MKCQGIRWARSTRRTCCGSSSCDGSKTALWWKRGHQCKILLLLLTDKCGLVKKIYKLLWLKIACINQGTLNTVFLFCFLQIVFHRFAIRFAFVSLRDISDSTRGQCFRCLSSVLCFRMICSVCVCVCVCDASSFIFLSLTNNEYISIQKKTFFLIKWEIK